MIVQPSSACRVGKQGDQSFQSHWGHPTLKSLLVEEENEKDTEVEIGAEEEGEILMGF